MDRHPSAAFEPDQFDESSTAVPERVIRLLAGNRSPGVEPRLMFPGWGPKLWERPVRRCLEPDEQRYGG
jgi:hypothetical protein